jgi:hypothetical protein
MRTYDGFLAEFRGDGILAYFGYPIARFQTHLGAVPVALNAVPPVHREQFDLGADLSEGFRGNPAVDEIGEQTRVERHKRKIAQPLAAAPNRRRERWGAFKQFRQLIVGPARHVHVPDSGEFAIGESRVRRGELGGEDGAYGRLEADASSGGVSATSGKQIGISRFVWVRGHDRIR